MVPVIGEINKKYSNFELVHFFFSVDEVKDGTYDTLPAIIYKGAIDKIHNVNKIIYHNIIIWKTILQP